MAEKAVSYLNDCKVGEVQSLVHHTLVVWSDCTQKEQRRFAADLIIDLPRDCPTSHHPMHQEEQHLKPIDVRLIVPVQEVLVMNFLLFDYFCWSW